MKKKLLMALFTVIIMCLLTISVSAANEVTFEDGQTADFETVFKVGTSGGVENVVTGYNSGYSNANITDVTFPDEINGIESNFLFSDAPKVKTITFAATDTFFISGDNIFSNCSVETITFDPDCIVELRKGNFSGCTSLTKITFPKFKKLAGSAFNGCTNMKNTNELVLVEGMTEIGGHAFQSCKSVTGTVYFPSTLETIYEYSFQNTGFTNFDLSKCSSLSSVGGGYGGPFTDSDYITKLDLSACTSLTSIKSSFVANSDNLVEVILPPNLTSIPHKAFAHCYKLQYIVFPESMEYVADEAFHSARKNQTVTTFTVYLQSAVEFHSTYPFRDSGAMIEFVLLNGVTAAEFKAANTFSSITNATVVDYLAEGSKWTYTPSGTISTPTIVENYCTTLGVTKSHSATDAICNNTDLCTDCGYTTLTPHEGEMSIVYPNGYNANGEKRTCSNPVCGGSKPSAIKPLFVPKGYSIKEIDGYGITATYVINDDELEEFEKLNGKLTFGVLMANANFDGQSEFMSKDENGNYVLNTTRGIKAEMLDRGYSRIDMRVDNFSQNEATLNLVMSLYVVDENGIYYIQNDGTYAGTVTKGDVTLDIVTIVKIADIVGVQLPFVVPSTPSEIKENL